jgi:hypothetical protein
MAVGDFFTFLVNAGGVYQDFVPAGSDKWMCLSMGSSDRGTLYVYDGAVQSNCVVYPVPPAVVSGATFNNMKIIFDNTDYARVIATDFVHAMFVQVE